MTLSFAPGAIIANLRIERQLGAGGFGEVWLAEHLDLGYRVAVKIPLLSEYVRLLRLEGRLQHQLDHENIVHVIDLNTTHDPPYCVTEFVDGENLRQRLDREGRLPMAQVRAMSRAMLMGLREAHRVGIVHRDLKPENILLGNDGSVKIADFGLGSVVNEITQSIVRSSRASSIAAAPGASPDPVSDNYSPADSIARSESLGPVSLTARIVGTYDYMSPEQRAGEEVDARSDIYSLGVMLVEMLTGQRPFGDVSARLRRHEVPSDTAEALLVALDDKDYRHADADAFMRALRIELPSATGSVAGTIPGQIESFLTGLEDRLAYIEGGAFTMGSDHGPDNERPAHRCLVSPFCLARHAVTASEFVLFLNDIGGNKTRLFRPGRASTIELVGAVYRPAPGCQNHPANCVSYAGASMFCDWVTRRLGQEYRLPTEAEWEFVASGGGLRFVYPWGNEPPTPERARFARQMTTPEEALAPVDAYGGGPLGHHQMAGNVAEWCRDPYLGNYRHAAIDPPDGSAAGGRLYVARGGCWSGASDDLRNTRRRVHIGQTFSPAIGFRIARSIAGRARQ